MTKIDFYSGQFYIPEEKEIVEFDDVILYGDGEHTCHQLYDYKVYKGIILNGEVVKCNHIVFDYIEGDGKHTKEELIKIREEKLRDYLNNILWRDEK